MCCHSPSSHTCAVTAHPLTHVLSQSILSNLVEGLDPSAQVSLTGRFAGGAGGQPCTCRATLFRAFESSALPKRYGYISWVHWTAWLPLLICSLDWPQVAGSWTHQGRTISKTALVLTLKHHVIHE